MTKKQESRCILGKAISKCVERDCRYFDTRNSKCTYLRLKDKYGKAAVKK